MTKTQHSPGSAGDSVIPPASNRSSNVFALGFVAAVGGFLFGFDLGIIGSANVFLKDQFALSDTGLGFVTASAVLGCMFGPVLGAWLCDTWGRRPTMVAAASLLGVNAVMTAMPDLLSPGNPHTTLVVFNVFRFIGGIGVGLCSIASPMYIAEVSPPRRRGRLGMMYQLAVVTGHIIAPLIGYLVVRLLPSVEAGEAHPLHQPWRWMFASAVIFVVLFLVFLLRLPESPRWLAQQGRWDEARQVMRQIEGEAHAERELAEIKGSLQTDARSGWRELFAPGLRFPLFIGVLLAFFNNWTGWSVMGGYVPMLFEMAGLDDRARAILQFAVTYGFMGIMTLFSLFLMDRVGRRPLWLVASLLMAGITCLTGFVFHYHLGGLTVLLVIMLCTVPHGLALGGIPWLMMSELFPTHLRAKAVSLTTTCLWFFIFSAAYLFPLLTTVSKRLVGSVGGVFWLFTGVCLLSFLFGLLVMPETRGRTLEEISQSWRKADRSAAKPGNAMGNPPDPS